VSGERKVGRGHAFAQRTREVHADDIGREKIDRLAEHARLGFDAADAPTDNAEAVDSSSCASRCRRACRDNKRPPRP